MSARTARTHRTRLFATTAVALAALSLTACQGDDTKGAGSSSSSATANGTGGTSASQPAQGGAGSAGQSSNTSGTGSKGSQGTSGAKGSAASSGSSGTSGSGGGGKGGTQAGQSSRVPGKCGAASVRITATVVSRPLNHLLLTATNTGSKTCQLPAYPMARFGEAQAVPPVAEQTKPQAPTELEPGKSGYAGVLLSAGDGSAEGGHTVHTLTVPFDDGSIARVTLPAKGVHVDNSLTVTYWQPSLDTALDY
ncbi:DUF4232 domain-containing protein [Streptomyces naganishii]|uniref:DUF4232 domain-containing protein n=1 Tax=Streptomyces naganishii JCM 4654 TaxID=1306179 RepID=A0A919CXD5_9ACTN|nr:DUF4232 domain-containing protein [Streptomyces naganishii]GHD93901.1 hypothetical protein GCM10010508_52480 [Streptomyces naganishii JCM 4654]